MGINFPIVHEISELSMKNEKYLISWTIVHEMTTPSIGGQLSVDNRCPWTIVHETYKTQIIL
jgi:hypothetical protein